MPAVWASAETQNLTDGVRRYRVRRSERGLGIPSVVSNLGECRYLVFREANAGMDFVENVEQLRTHQGAYRALREVSGTFRAGERADPGSLGPVRLGRPREGSVGEQRLARVPEASQLMRRTWARPRGIDLAEYRKSLGMRDPCRSQRCSRTRSVECAFECLRG